jgi:TIR domain
MKVFISWSGELSRQVALALREWLPSVIQSIEPYVSSEDIDKGARWSTDIAAELEKSAYGILCVTKDNLLAPWINFEAGALSKSIDKGRVSPFLFGLKRSDIKTGPLLQFQSTVTDAQDVQKLVVSLNSSCEPPLLEEQRLVNIFDVWWPKLDEKLNLLLKSAANDIASNEVNEQKAPADAEILEEILELARQQNRIINSPHNLLPAEYLRDAMSVVRPNERENGVYRDLEDRWYRAMFTLNTLKDAEFIPRQIVTDIISSLEKPVMYLTGRRGHQVPLFEKMPLRPYVHKASDPLTDA